MSKIQIALSSPTSWLIVGSFLLAGVSAIIPQLQGTPDLIAIALAAGLGAILHPGEVQQAGRTQ